jgi:hypothetical protein
MVFRLTGASTKRLLSDEPFAPRREGSQGVTQDVYPDLWHGSLKR